MSEHVTFQIGALGKSAVTVDKRTNVRFFAYSNNEYGYTVDFMTQLHKITSVCPNMSFQVEVERKPLVASFERTLEKINPES